MKKKVLNNWTLKILSVLIAVVVWMIVVNYDDPYQTRTITGIPIEVVNADTLAENNLIYEVVGTPTATVRVRCRRMVAQSLRSTDFKAEADFNNLYEMTNQIPITISCVSGKVSDTEMTQVTQSMEVSLERVDTRRMTVQYQVEGKPAEGYTVGAVRCSPQTVTVRAPESFLDQVSGVGVTVNVDDVSQNVTHTCPLQFYGAGGNILSTSDVAVLEISTADIYVEVEILTVKTVNIGYEVVGTDNVARGYQYSGAEPNITSVEISGRRSVLAGVDTLQLPANELDVTGATENITRTFDLREYLPEGVSLVNENDYNFTITLRIEQLETRDYQLDLSQLTIENLDEALVIGNEDAGVTITVEGLASDLEELALNEIEARVDLAGYSAGTFNIPVLVEVPSGYSVVGTVNVRLQLIPRETAAPSSSSETEPSESQASEESGQESRPAAESKDTQNQGEDSGENSTQR